MFLQEHFGTFARHTSLTQQPVVPSVALRLDVTNRNAKSRDLLVWAALPNHAGDP